MNCFFSTANLSHPILQQVPVFIVDPTIRNYSPMEISQIYYNYTFWRGALKVLSTKKPNFLYQRCSTLNCSGVLLSLSLGVPLILEFNSSVFWGRLSDSKVRLKFTKLLFEKINLLGCSRVVVVSQVLKERLIAFGVNERKILVNINGVDTEVFAPETEKKGLPTEADSHLFVGFVGIFESWHGVITLAKSVKHVIAKDANVQFLIIGKGKLRDDMEEILRNDGMQNMVTFTGLIPHERVPSYLNSCHILVSPHQNMFDGSTFLGSPTKLFEYMAMGKAIVASGVGQISEILRDGENALLVPPGDERALAGAVLRLAADQDLRERLGARARAEVIEKYTWKSNVQKVLELYNEVTTP